MTREELQRAEDKARAEAERWREWERDAPFQEAKRAEAAYQAEMNKLKNRF